VGNASRLLTVNGGSRHVATCSHLANALLVALVLCRTGGSTLTTNTSQMVH